jgi:hypothetical protein
VANLCLTCVFALELLLKLLGLGTAKYLSDKFNIFDALVVALSMMELGLSGGGGGGSNLSAMRSFRSLRVLKSFRVLRLFKMFRCAGRRRWWPREAAESAACAQRPGPVHFNPDLPLLEIQSPPKQPPRPPALPPSPSARAGTCSRCAR